MSCNSKLLDKKPNPSHEPATLWEHFVLHKASEKKVMLFDLELEDKKPGTNKLHKKRKMSALDAATTITMQERQRSVSAPIPVASTLTHPDNTNTETAGKLPQPFQPNLQPPHTPSNSTSQTSHSTSFDSITLDSSHSITFGPQHLLALSPKTLRDESKRQASLIKTRRTEGLTMKRRLRSDEAQAFHDEDLMMSGALEAGDVRCEVCAARERAMGGLEEAGIVAL